MREVLRYDPYAYRTEQAYCQWMRHDVHDCGGRTHPKQLGALDVERFLSHLATAGNVSASTPRQALNALIFPYRDVPPLADHIAPVRSHRQPRPTTALMAKRLYGGGLRLLE